MIALIFAGNTFTGNLQIEKYEVDGSIAITFNHPTKGRFRVPSVWIPGLAPDEVAIKNYSENEGILSQLIEMGIVLKPHRFQKSGWIDIPVCKLNPNWEANLEHVTTMEETGGQDPDNIAQEIENNREI